MHLVEPLGRGGVFQHSIALGEALAARGWTVTLHPARDSEIQRTTGIALCTCVDWKRGMRSGPRRRATIAARFLGRTVPHLLRVIRRRKPVHVQGYFYLPL